MQTEGEVMTGIDVVKIVNDKVLEFGNERFLEGWNGAEDRIVDMLRDKYDKILDEVGIVVSMDELDLIQEIIAFIGEPK
jgi:hypothetical protein